MATPLTAFGELLTADLTPIFQGSFEATVSNTQLTTNFVAGGGAVAQSDAMAVVSTSTTTESTARLVSKRHARYRAGMGAVMRFTALFSAPVAGTDQLIGLSDEVGSTSAFKNGLMVGYVDGVFGFHRFTDDTTTSYPITTWADPLDSFGDSRGTLDPTKLNIFYIQYGYLGVANPAVFWMGQDGIVYKVCMMRTAGILTAPHSYNPNYHFMMLADNKITTSNVSLKCASYAYLVEGRVNMQELQQFHNSSGEQTKAEVTTETAIFTIRNRSAYASKTNYIDILLESATASIEAVAANNLASLRLVMNTTLGGTPSWADVNTTNSVAEIDMAGTTVTGGTTIATFPLAGKNDSHVFSGRGFNMILSPGETVTLAATSSNSATVNGSCLWKELF